MIDAYREKVADSENTDGDRAYFRTALQIIKQVRYYATKCEEHFIPIPDWVRPSTPLGEFYYGYCLEQQEGLVLLAQLARVFSDEKMTVLMLSGTARTGIHIRPETTA